MIEQQGSGRPLLFIHGTGTHRQVFGPVIEHLGSGYKATIYDRRGFGDSAGDSAAHYPDHVQDAAWILDSLGPETVVVAQSGSGPIGLALASKFPEGMSALVLGEPAWRLSGVMPSAASLAASAGLAYRRWLKRDPQGAALDYYRWASRYRSGGNAWEGLPAEWRELALTPSHVKATLREVNQLLRPWPSASAVGSIAVPVTLVIGDNGEPIFHRTTRRVQRAIPSARMEEIPGTSHLLFLDEPQRFAEIVAEAASATA